MSSYVRKVHIPNITVRCDAQDCTFKRIVWGKDGEDALRLSARAYLTLRAHQHIHKREKRA